MTSDGRDRGARFHRQWTQYAFPYHWLPALDGSAASIARNLPWGLEYLAVLETTASMVIDTDPLRVLDLGCGDGRLAVELARRDVPEIVGIDLVPQAIAFARGFGLPFDAVRFECTRVEALDAGTFDTAVMMEVLEHVPDAEIGSVIDALAERVHSEGRLIVSVPTTNVPLIAKHERHYTVGLLRSHISPHFEIGTVRFVHRTSGTNRMLRHALINRFVSLEEPHLRRLVTELYRRSGRDADARDGAHLIALCRRV